jgi:hypothetical protein
MKTQLEHYETARRKIAARAHAFNEMLQSPNRPTQEELEKLRAKRPGLWNAYRDANPPQAAQTV